MHPTVSRHIKFYDLHTEEERARGIQDALLDFYTEYDQRFGSFFELGLEPPLRLEQQLLSEYKDRILDLVEKRP